MEDFKRSKLGSLLDLDAKAIGLYREAADLKAKGGAYWRPSADALGISNLFLSTVNLSSFLNFLIIFSASSRSIWKVENESCICLPLHGSSRDLFTD